MLLPARSAAWTIAKTLPVMAVLMAVVSMPVAAETQSITYDLTGRWTSANHKYVLDIVKCGEDWCGVKINADQSCGAIALRLSHVAKAGTIVMLNGRLDLQPEIEPYEVSISFDNANNANPTQIQMLGDPNEAPSLMTRTIRFYDLLARSGEAQCKAESKTS